ncbi:VOC family protein [Paenibacillus lemnae]|uniref:VOC family protein n=1 Tax=Paenibacillus lemnae TaxID=1330551 RepID=A0A848M669_PAELE|nr:VOC family protein [Paenibacillus lemnae]NMO96106.1 VOC family protein [Paenibacillus lemnae]
MTAVLHPSTRLGEVSLRIRDLDTSVAFYTEVVGLKLLKQEGNVAQLSADGTTPLVILEAVEGLQVQPERSAAGLYHFAILVPDRSTLGLVVRNLSKHRIAVGQGDHLVSEALYISDPDNNGIEIYADRPRETWKWSDNGEVQMATDPVDVDGLLAASQNLEWRGLPAETVIGHVHFHVSDLVQARHFYCDILGFEITAHYGGAALFIAAGQYHHHIGLNTWAGLGVPNTPADAAGMNDFTVIMPDTAELFKVIERVQAFGLPLEKRDGTVYVTDPSGIRVRLVEASAV